MTRCIHCTRCVRFGQEIAGVMELGMIGRGEHSEIVTFVGKTVDSELSGNMIDLCPVGALTSKPFRYSARAWELSRRKIDQPARRLGSNLIVQVQAAARDARAAAARTKAINECWLSDRDRFSYEGAERGRSADRADDPPGRRVEDVDWHDALEYVVARPEGIAREHGAQSIGALASPIRRSRSCICSRKLVRGARQRERRLPPAPDRFPRAGRRDCAVARHADRRRSASSERVLVIGSFLRKDQPLLAQRIRQAAQEGRQGIDAAAARRRLLMPMRHQASSSRRARWRDALGADRRRDRGRARRRARRRGADAAATSEGDRRGAGERRAQARVLLGNFAAQHPDSAAARMRSARWIARADRRHASACSTRREPRRRAPRRRACRGKGGSNARADARATRRQGLPAAQRRAGARFRRPGARASPR